MEKNLIQKVKSVFENYPAVKLAYVFGSQVRGKIGPMSDYDFAVYLNEFDKKKIFEIKLELLNKLSQVLATDKVDLVILNTAQSPELKYNIIKEGKLIFEREPFKVLVEPKILNEYFDFYTQLLKYGLTHS